MYQSIFYDRKSNFVHVWDDQNGYAKVKYAPYAYKRKKGGKYKSIYGEELEKVEKFNPRDPSLLESDVPVETRFLIDVYGESDDASVNHRVAILDIEVDSTGGYPNLQDPKQKITAIALSDVAKNKYYCFVLDEGGVVKDGEMHGAYVSAYLHEEDLLTAFLERWREVNPTVATGWNIDGFDFPYLYGRLSKVFDEETASQLSPIDICYFNKYKNKMTIAGISTLDYLLLYKKYSGKSLPNYRLDTVAKEEVKVGKVEYDGSLDDLKKTDINKFIEYNLHDIILVRKIDSKLQFIELAQSICHVCHTGYEEFSVSSKILEGALLTYLRRKKLVAPSKNLNKNDNEGLDDDDDSEEGFVGAYVKDPIPGRYEWVCSADINSLYPSVIMSINISPETKIDVILNWSSEKYAKKSEEIVEFGGDKYSYKQLNELFVENNFAISANGVVYNQAKIGCVPDILKKWFSERKEFQGKMRDADKADDKVGYAFWKRRQQVQKILLNSLYGVLGLPIFRFYDLDNASAVTLTGQEIIKTSARFVNGRFNKRCNTTDKDYVIYIDTDSLYLDINSLAKAEKIEDIKPYAIKTIGDVADSLNDFYKVMMVKMFNSSDNRIKIAPDVVAQSAFWIVKKRYAMLKIYNMELNKDINDIEIKGLDVVRSSYPKKFRDFMSSVLEDILRGTDKKQLDKKILEFKTDMKNFNLEDIAKNTSVRFLSNTEPKIDFNPKNRDLFHFLDGSTAQCKAALAYNDLLKRHNLSETEPIMSGGKIKWAYLKNNPFNLDGLAFKDDGKDPKVVIDFINTYIDRSRIWDAELEKKLINFYNAMNWDLYSEEAETIDQFFSFDT